MPRSRAAAAARPASQNENSGEFETQESRCIDLIHNGLSCPISASRFDANRNTRASPSFGAMAAPPALTLSPTSAVQHTDPGRGSPHKFFRAIPLWATGNAVGEILPLFLCRASCSRRSNRLRDSHPPGVRQLTRRRLAISAQYVPVIPSWCCDGELRIAMRQSARETVNHPCGYDRERQQSDFAVQLDPRCGARQQAANRQTVHSAANV